MKQFLHSGLKMSPNENGELVINFDHPLVVSSGGVYNNLGEYLSHVQKTVYDTLIALVKEAGELKTEINYSGTLPGVAQYGQDAIILPNPHSTDGLGRWRIAASRQRNINNSPSDSNYTVAAGDTLWKIAHDLNIPLPELEKLNPQIENPDLIYPGDVINLPEGRNFALLKTTKNRQSVQDLIAAHNLDKDKSESNNFMFDNEKYIAWKYGKNDLERNNPEIYFQNRQNEAFKAVSKAERIFWDVVIIAGGVLTVIETAGADAPLVVTIIGGLAGPFAVAGGSVKFVCEVSGHGDVADKVPTSYFGSLAMMVETAVGDKKHLVSGVISFIEGVYIWKPTDIDAFKTALGGLHYTDHAIQVLSEGIVLSKEFFDNFTGVMNNGNAASGNGQKSPTSQTLTPEEREKIIKYINTLPKTDK
jgi:hypothetical protein